MSDPNETREDYCRRMIAEGYVISLPGERELQLDIDTGAQLDEFKRVWPFFTRMVADLHTQREEEARALLPIEKRTPYCNWQADYVATPSKGGSGCHIRIQLPFEIDATERMLLQACLQSDPLRELLSWVRLCKGDAVPTLLVEKP